MIGLKTLTVLGFIAALTFCAHAEKLNIIVFYVDDMGWTDLGCYGSDFYETPNVDALAASGMKFTDGYAACTVCSPSRAAFMTGKSPARLRVTDFIPGHPIENTPLSIPDWTQHLAHEEVTVAELLKADGYATAHLGKWHLTHRDRGSASNLGDGDYPEQYPQHHGFDHNIGGCEKGAPPSYFWPYGRGKTLEERQAQNIFATLPPGGEEGEYLTDRLADEAVRLLDDFAGQPFFMSFCFYNVHTPLQGRPDLVKKYQAKLDANPDGRHRNPVYAAMVESVDLAVGQVLGKLEELGMVDQTVIVFTSDNGGLRPQATDNAPLRQGKGSIYEGGVRVPFIVRWPGVTKQGTVSDEPVITMDLLPTILDAAGGTIPAELAPRLDGVSLKPVLSDSTADLERAAIYWHYPHYHMMGGRPYSAVRAGDWKLIEPLETGVLELYNLAEDIHEDHNLASQHPEKTEELVKQLRDWRTRVDAQMPTKNANYDPSRPLGRKQGNQWREPAVVRE